MSTITEINGFDEYRKTCSVIFGNATSSQLKYLEASIQLQQTALTSCDGIIANQLKWLQNYVNKNKDTTLVIDAFLKIYTDTINMLMNFVSISYDLTTSNIQSYTRTLNSLNEYFFGIKEGQGEIEGVRVSGS
jgi:FlaG/FlaF family flagellin (archaellin)